MRVSDDRAIWLSRQVLPHEGALRAWLARRPVAGLDIDDIVQETYARLIAVEEVSSIDNVKGYMFQAAWSIMVSHVRRAKIVSFQAYGDLDALGAETTEASPEAHVAGRDELRRLAEAIAGLPGKIQDVFVLRRVRGLSQREVAEKLGLSQSTVEKHMSRGIYLLMKLISHSGNDMARASRAWDSRLHKGPADSERRRNSPSKRTSRHRSGD
jgi:RNA polymerase sigma-70 factor (ECF subfamily)